MQDTQDNRIFSRGVEELTLPPNPRWSTHTRVLLPCFTKEKWSLRMLLLYLMNGELHTVYKLFVLGLSQTPRANQEPPNHQDCLGAVKHQE